MPAGNKREHYILRRMKMKKILGAVCLLVLSVPLFADMSKEELQKMYLDYLKSRNIQASVDSDGDIEFRYEGAHFNEMTFWIGVDEKDQQHFRIFKADLYTFKNEAEKRKAPIAAANASRRADVAKIYISSNGKVNASSSAFLVTPQDFKTVFVRLMRELDSVMLYFLDELK
jgi:hypothetical protein